MKCKLTVIILTYNEEVNIYQSLKNVIKWAEYVYVLDSYSTDNTTKIAEELGAYVFYNKFENYSKQRNFAINELPVKTDWILFLDADEYLTEELKHEISSVLPNTNQDGFYLKRRFYFMGKWIKHGGYYPTWILRLFKKDKGYFDRKINEQLIVKGSVGKLKYDFIDYNHKGISEWLDKHNRYSTFEAQELINQKMNKGQKDELANLFGNQVERKRWVRKYIWNPLLPPLFRPFLYYIYRYILRFGFLDGKAGFIYHTLHGLFYMFLIDVKYIEKK